MSATSDYPTWREWLRRFVTGQPHQVIGGLDDPYLRRWYVIPRNPWLNIYVHQFLRSDDDRALHDHPWWFASLMLRGCYMDVSQRDDDIVLSESRCAPMSRWLTDRGRNVLVFRPATYRHRVELLNDNGREIPCWTLIVTGRRSRTWGFWCRYLIDHQSAQTRGEQDRVMATTFGQSEVERFVPWQEFGDAGCGEH